MSAAERSQYDHCVVHLVFGQLPNDHYNAEDMGIIWEGSKFCSTQRCHQKLAVQILALRWPHHGSYLSTYAQLMLLGIVGIYRPG